MSKSLTGAAGKSSPIWHPFTQHALVKDFPMIAWAKGAHLYTDAGEPIIDAISSWWVITHEHANARIVDAIKAQADQLDQVIFANYTHQPAEELAKELIAITPDGLDRVFYSDSGSTAVEVALKMALGFWANSGAPRHRILVLEHGYHGDTIGAMSVGARGVFNATYDPLLFDVECIPFPAEGRQQATLDALEAACKGRGQNDKPAAFILEPLVLGAGGMMIYDAATLREMRAICAREDVLFIADEVMTGWGRTGARFACDHAGVTPDIACYAKGLTGGAVPLAATLCAERIFDAHYSADRSKTFFHSSSFTANPIACAAALENLAIWRDEPVMERIAQVAAMQSAGLATLRGVHGVTNLRQCGTIAALDVEADAAGYLSEIGPKMHEFFASRGVLLRPLGNCIYVMPPYCIEQADMDEIYDAIGACVEMIGARS